MYNETLRFIGLIGFVLVVSYAIHFFIKLAVKKAIEEVMPFTINYDHEKIAEVIFKKDKQVNKLDLCDEK